MFECWFEIEVSIHKGIQELNKRLMMSIKQRVQKCFWVFGFQRSGAINLVPPISHRIGETP